MRSSTTSHQWKFARIGGLDQVVLETADDVRNLEHLDQKLWVALSCPIKSLEYDEETFQLLDTDGDGRIRANEILQAIKWLDSRLTDLGAILNPQDHLPLDAINSATPEGAALLASARAPEGVLRVSTLSEERKRFIESAYNGDGVIPADSADVPALRTLIENIITVQGAAKDLSGKPGVTQEKIDAFYAAVAAHIAHAGKAKAAPEIFVFGDKTSAAFAAFKTVRDKVEDYFSRCRLAAFDSRTLTSLNRAESDYAAVLTKDLKAGASELSGFPLAHIAPPTGKAAALPLGEGINPAWAGAMATFTANTVTVAFGTEKKEITSAEWDMIKAKLAPYETWSNSFAAEAGASREAMLALAALGDARIGEINATAKPDQAALTALVAKDKALEPEALAMNDVNRLVHYYSHLGKLLRNFVNFADFYAPDRDAIFQAGVLYLDSRTCELCIRVTDPAAHSVLGSLSKACIAYCDLTRAGEKPVKVAACFTQGDSDYLMVGRNGIFYDTKGRDWDATITKLVTNPISIREAFWSPYKKLVRTLEEQINKRAATAEGKVSANMEGAATAAAATDSAAMTAAAQTATPAAKKMDVGTVAAMGVALGAIAGAIAAMATGMARLAPWQIPLVPIVIVLIISGPSMFIAWMKLRQRTLGPLLDAAGWAINGRVKINVPLGTSLTERAVLPADAHRTLKDPYEDKEAKSRKRRLVLTLIILALLAGAGWAYWDYHQMHSWFWERL